MQGNEERSESADGAGGRGQGRRRSRTSAYRRAGALAVLVATAAIGLAAFVSAGSANVASSAKSNSRSTRSKTSRGNGSKRTTTRVRFGTATKLTDEWAACERSHGDVNQADPVIDAHGVINITLPGLGQGAVPVGNPHNATGECSEYLVAAQRALRAADPVRDPLGMRNQADLLRYVGCMRASGVPNYPYPTGNTTNFNGTGVNPNSPFVVRVSIRCGDKLGLPLWWSAGWGPPGDIAVSMAGLNPNGRLSFCAYKKKGCPRPPRPAAPQR